MFALSMVLLFGFYLLWEDERGEGCVLTIFQVVQSGEDC